MLKLCAPPLSILPFSADYTALEEDATKKRQTKKDGDRLSRRKYCQGGEQPTQGSQAKPGRDYFA